MPLHRSFLVLFGGVTAASAGCAAITDLDGLRSDGVHAEGGLPDEGGLTKFPEEDPDCSAPDPKLLSDATEIAVGGRFACALRTNASVACWGLFSGTTAFKVPVTIPHLPPIAHIRAGYANVCAVTLDGHAYCWGNDDWAQLGSRLPDGGLPTQFPAPVVYVYGANQPPLGNVTAVAAGERHACAIASGVVVCWGDDGLGQVDGHAGGLVAHPTLSPVHANAEDVATGSVHSCAIRFANDEHVVECWGSNTYGAVGVTDGGVSPAVTTWDLNAFGAASPVAVRVSYDATCVLDAHHYVYCAGSNLHGQLGPTGPGPFPLQIVQGLGADGVFPLEIALGNIDLCVLTAEHTVACIGANHHGELGRGTMTDPETTFAPVVGVENKSVLKYVLHVATGAEGTTAGTSCAIVGKSLCSTSGHVVCWGSNADAQLGDGTTLSSASPVEVLAVEP